MASYSFHACIQSAVTTVLLLFLTGLQSRTACARHTHRQLLAQPLQPLEIHFVSIGRGVNTETLHWREDLTSCAFEAAGAAATVIVYLNPNHVLPSDVSNVCQEHQYDKDYACVQQGLTKIVSVRSKG
jgi:hypothetical protein